MNYYYDTRQKQTVNIDGTLSLAELRNVGILPVQEAVVELEFWQKRINGRLECNEESCQYMYDVVPKTIDELRQALADAKLILACADAFAEIDTKRNRSMATIIEAQALGFPSEEYADDINILGQLNMVAEENRDLVHELQALTITDEMTLEEAQNVVRKARDMRPWLPWREAQKP